ncbi:hypothetical protein BCR39DRAFT_513465 [Naematelia encephala]|uniref:Chromatin modification-related protein EAF7-domain-containing protein n=1 Tax=Naematelia encephala TaxID=71784 RepID=A0A1Y2BIH2_9TREE|nr:hypothetical protein BCR39DRAFT_513465 [Naematelia encephala]
MSNSPDRAGSSAPLATELDVELALLKSLPEARPVGRNKHFGIIQLQATIHRRTGVLLDVSDLWSRLDDLFDMDALNDMASSSTVSIPASPEPLSPLIRPRHSRSTTSLSSISSSGHGGKESRSAKVIDSRHFASTFEIPYLRGEERDASVSVTKESEESDQVWPGIIYPRAESGVQEDPTWGNNQPGLGIAATPTATAKKGKKGKGKVEESVRAGSSSLSEDEDRKGRRTSGTGIKKRKRESGTTVDASEDEVSVAPKSERRRRKR